MADWTRAEKLLRDAIASGALPAVVAGVTTRDGVAFTSAYGQRTASGGDVNASTMFWIASMTKGITSIAAMQMVERGLLPLDEPLSNVLPELRDWPILKGFADDGKPVLRPATKPITLAHLLSHSSGFAENVWSADMLRYVEATGTPTGGTGKRAAADLPLLFEPGTDWHYGISHDWAGFAVEKASGQRLDAYLAENLFRPVGMKDTTYLPNEEQRARLIQVRRRDAEGALQPFDRTILSEREYFSGGGTLHSTAGDYLAFVRMLLRDGEGDFGRVLKPETVEMLAQNRTPGMQVSTLDPVLRQMSNPVEMLPGAKKCWGLGFMVNLEDLPTGRKAGSLAWAGLPNTYYWIDRASGIGGVMMTQILPFADKASLDVFEAFETAAYQALA